MIHNTSLNFATYLIPILASQLFFSLAFSNHVLIIGRPENGGINMAEAVKTFPEIDGSVVWYLDPRSTGGNSIPQYFPCNMPSEGPQQFEVVCLEQGMLNEVVISLFSARPSSDLVLNSPQRTCSNLSQEDEIRLQELSLKRNEIFDLWQKAKREQREFELAVIEQALNSNLIVAVNENGEEYYRVGQLPNTFGKMVIANRLFENKAHFPKALFAAVESLEQTYYQLAQEVDARKNIMNEIDKMIDPLIKLKDHETPTISGESTSATEPSAKNATPITRTPNDVCHDVEEMIRRAWGLVNSEGKLLVFKGNGVIDGTALCQGISEEFLTRILSTNLSIDERSFPQQSYEGEIYISNPALPAIWDAFGWGGGRDAGSYFVLSAPKRG